MAIGALPSCAAPDPRLPANSIIESINPQPRRNSRSAKMRLWRLGLSSYIVLSAFLRPNCVSVLNSSKKPWAESSKTLVQSSQKLRLGLGPPAEPEAASRSPHSTAVGLGWL